MNYLLFAVYLFVLCWLLLLVPFTKNAGIAGKTLLALFLFKIVAGIAIGWISIHIYGPGNDYWDVHDFALEEYQLLFTDPGKYFSNIFTSDYQTGYSGVFSSYNSYWNDLRNNLIIKLVSVFNIFSRGDYYINSLFFNFIIFFGHVTLYRLLIKIFPGREWLVIMGCFLLPSTLYFSSGIHKDGVVFLTLAILIYSIYQSLLKNKFTVKRLLLVLISLALLFLIRSFVFLALIPALFAWVLAAKVNWHARWTYLGVYLITGLLFFNIGFISERIQPMDIIIKRQTEYMKLPVAATQIQLTPLIASFKSFAGNVPEALNHSLMRPYLWEKPVMSLLPLSIELFFYQLLFLLFLFFRRKDTEPVNKPFLLFALCFCLSVFLVIGYIVPNLGTLVRYRSLYLPLLITPLICYVDWKRMAGLIKIIK